MLLFNTYRENPSAPIVRVTGFGSMCRMGGEILVTAISELPTATGRIDISAAVHLIWPTAAWVSAIYLSRYAQREFRRGAFDAPHLFRAN